MRNRAEAAEKRVVELQATLDAQWRPVTDDEPDCGNTVQLLVTGFRDEFGNWLYRDGDAPLREKIKAAATSEELHQLIATWQSAQPA